MSAAVKQEVPSTGGPLAPTEMDVVVAAPADDDKKEAAPTTAPTSASPPRASTEPATATVSSTPKKATASTSSTSSASGIDPSILFRALRVPSTDARDPLGRLFPSDELLEELVAASST